MQIVKNVSCFPEASIRVRRTDIYRVLIAQGLRLSKAMKIPELGNSGFRLRDFQFSVIKCTNAIRITQYGIPSFSLTFTSQNLNQ